jgi:hypothetical protein
MITVEHTTRTYSGKTGCMCGCRGTYNESPRARKLALTQLLNDPTVKLDDWGNEGCLFVESDTRNRVLYLTAEGVAEAKKMGVELNI